MVIFSCWVGGLTGDRTFIGDWVFTCESSTKNKVHTLSKPTSESSGTVLTDFAGLFTFLSHCCFLISKCWSKLLIDSHLDSPPLVSLSVSSISLSDSSGLVVASVCGTGEIWVSVAAAMTWLVLCGLSFRRRGFNLSWRRSLMSKIV